VISIHGRIVSWQGDELRSLSNGRVLAKIECDEQWPSMWRVVFSDGRRSDMLNRTRAKNEALVAVDRMFEAPTDARRGARARLFASEEAPVLDASKHRMCGPAKASVGRRVA
jgi:hypothetical protein